MIVSSATSKSSLITENCFGMPFEILVSLKSRLRKCTEAKKLYRITQILYQLQMPPMTSIDV